MPDSARAEQATRTTQQRLMDWFDGLIDRQPFTAIGLVFGAGLLVIVVLLVVLLLALRVLSGPEVEHTYPAENCRNTTMLVGKVFLPAIACKD